MAFSTYYDMVRVAVGTTGTGTVTLGAAVAGHRSFSNAAVPNGATVTYTLLDGTNFEVGQGVYNSGAATLTRATIFASSNSGSAINLSGSAQLAISVSADGLSRMIAPAINPGFRNRLINGNFDVWQRGTSLTVSSTSVSYLADRWQAYNGGSNALTVSRVAAPTGFRGQYALRMQITAAAAGENFPVYQTIEARQIADLDGKNTVMSFDVQASTSAGTLTGSLDIVHNSALDNSSFSIGYTSIAFTVPSGAAVVSVAVPASVMVGAKYGSRVHVVFGQASATGNVDIYLGAVQFEADPSGAGKANGFEFRPLPVELALCQRYAQIIGSGAVGKATSASTWQGLAQFKTPMRATPTLTLLTTTILAAETGVSARASSGSTLSVYSVTDTSANDLGLSGWSGLTAPNFMTIATDCILASADL